MIKGIYAGGESSHIPARTAHHTASADGGFISKNVQFALRGVVTVKKNMLAFTIICILATACANQTVSTSTNTPASHSSLGSHFPQLVNTQSVYLEALIGGELALINGCLRVMDPEGNSILLIWDPRFSIREDQGAVQVIDDTGRVAANVGDFVRVGGGVTDDPTPLGLAEPLPEDCPGPYWLVGEWIRRIDASLGTHFPQLIRHQIPSTPTVIKGNLTLENGCLRLNVVDEDSFLLIWDTRFSTRTEQDVVRAVDSQTEDTLASTGDFVEVVGGVIDDPIGLGMIAPLPNDCPGPYFLVGGSIKKIEKP